jgi:HEPN domain-containing protein
VSGRVSIEDILAGNDAFLGYMQRIDERLRHKKVPIPGRPLNAMSLIAQDLKITIMMSGPADTRLADQIHLWFERRYGDRLKIDLSPGKAVIIIRGDPYVMKLPLIVGQWDGILDVTKLVEGMTQPLFAELPESEMSELINHFSWFMDRFRALEELPSNVRAELDAAVLHLASHQPNYGLSQWASLQFAEKTLKHFIRKKKQTPPNSHSLSKLLNMAENLGLPMGWRPLLALIQCDASVRYEGEVSLADAVLAHHASIDLAAYVSSYSGKIQSPETKHLRKDVPKMVISFSSGIETSHNGNLLVKLFFADGKVRRILFGAAHLFWLRRELEAAIAAGRHNDGRADIVNGEIVDSGRPRDPSRLFNMNKPNFGPEDFEEEYLQVESMVVTDHSNGVRFLLKSFDKKEREVIFSSPVLNYFLAEISSGIIEGKSGGLFVE